MSEDQFAEVRRNLEGILRQAQMQEPTAGNPGRGGKPSRELIQDLAQAVLDFIQAYRPQA